ncbi:MAG TPA: acyl-CoA dehydrogenase family protein [Waterburya sp.]
MYLPYSPNNTKDDCAMLLDVRKPPNNQDVAVSPSEQLAQSAILLETQVGSPKDEIERLRETGLLPLVVPKEYGGLGATWQEALKIVYELAKADGAIGQLYCNHLILTALAHVCGTAEQKEKYYRYTAQHQGFWANAIDTWDTRLRITPEGENFRLNGIKRFDAVVAAADWRVFSAWQDGRQEPFFCIIPQDRSGIICDKRGEKFGSEPTEQGSFVFYNVLVEKDEILGSPNHPEQTFTTFLGIITQLTKTYMGLGIGHSSLEAIQAYQRTTSQSRLTSIRGSAAAEAHPFSQYSDLWIELNTAMRVAEQVAEQLQVAWEKELQLTHEERGIVAGAVFSAEVFATRVILNITNRLLELMDNPILAKNCGLDRYWQDLRTLGGVSMPWQGVPQTWTVHHFPQQQTPC